jgi:hypothetical protein
MSYGLIFNKANGTPVFNTGDFFYYLYKRVRIYTSAKKYTDTQTNYSNLDAPVSYFVRTDSGKFPNTRDTGSLAPLCFCYNQSGLYVGMGRATYKGSGLNISPASNAVINVFGTASTSGYIDVYVFLPYLPTTVPEWGIAVYDSSGRIEFTSRYAPLAVSNNFVLNSTRSLSFNFSSLGGKGSIYKSTDFYASLPGNIAWNYPLSLGLSVNDDGYDGKDSTWFNGCWLRTSSSNLRLMVVGTSEDTSATYTRVFRRTMFLGIDVNIYNGLEYLYEEVSL